MKAFVIKSVLFVFPLLHGTEELRNRGGQNLCTNTGISIPEIEPIASVNEGGFNFDPVSFIRQGRERIATLKAQAQSGCETEAVRNWHMAQFFLTHFRMDQRDRKAMMKKLYEKTLQER